VDLRRRAIGVFDSGIGGLTVLAALRRRLQDEELIYLGDTARVPYGTRSPQVIARYAQNNARFLSGFDLKMLVVACNTVSAVALPELERTMPEKVLGVVEPGARAAAALQPKRLGVIGTAGTIRSGAYQAALARLAPGAEVRAVACPLLVPLAEEGWTDGEIPVQVARRYLGSLAGIDTLLLGCTHYPVLRGAIAAAVGPGVRLVDSAEATAEAAAAWLAAEQLGNDRGQPGGERLFVTDLSDSFGAVAARFLGRPVQTPELVDITV
jgi:glutamate racemase